MIDIFVVNHFLGAQSASKEYQSLIPLYAIPPHGHPGLEPGTTNTQKWT